MPYNEEADRKANQLRAEQEAKITHPLAKEVLEEIKSGHYAASDRGAYDHELGDYSLALKVQALETALNTCYCYPSKEDLQ